MSSLFVAVVFYGRRWNISVWFGTEKEELTDTTYKEGIDSQLKLMDSKEPCEHGEAWL